MVKEQAQARKNDCNVLDDLSMDEVISINFSSPLSLQQFVRGLKYCVREDDDQTGTSLKGGEGEQGRGARSMKTIRQWKRWRKMQESAL